MAGLACLVGDVTDVTDPDAEGGNGEETGTEGETGTTEPTEPGGDGGEEQPLAEKEYEVTITAPEGPFYIGETCETPFTATVWNKTDGYEVVEPKLVWSCTEDATIDTNTGVLSILNTATEDEIISITAKLIDENATSILSEGTYEIRVSVRPQYSITGKVIDQYDQEGIVGATVILTPTEGSKGQQVTTDTLPDGTFTLENVVGGTNTDYTLTVAKDGYTSYEYNNEISKIQRMT